MPTDLAAVNVSAMEIARPRTPSRSAATGESGVDAESRAWIETLRAADRAIREEATERLHATLLRAARHELGRRRAALAHVRGEELEDIATQAANDALIAVLSKLDDFRGQSRFTTWAYKFALLEAGVKLRRRAWQGHEVVLEPESWPLFESDGVAPQEEAERGDLMRCLRDAIESKLTTHQREVLVGLALNGVPIDVLAERLTTTRGALYKTLHDARHKLRAELDTAGFAVEEV